MREVPRQLTNRRGLLLAPIACVALSACVATKSDIRLLRTDMSALQAHQDSLYSMSLRDLRAQADSMRQLTDLLRTTRGQLANQLRQISDMVITLQQLSGQSAQTIRDLQQRIQEQAQQPRENPVPAPANVSSADDLYRAGFSKLQDRSPAAARAAFEQFLADYPSHERAPDAQFYLAETYVIDDALADAVTSFVRVSEAYPASSRAPEALYRAGEISEQRKKLDDARKYYTMVRTRYGTSPSARLAQQKLDRLKTR